MVAELLTGLGAFKAMLDMAKRLKDINDATVRNGAVIELQEKILTTRELQTALIERVSELEKEMARFETWETEKQRYALKQCAPGIFAYILKKTEASGEPGHALCAACYERGTKSILQGNGELQIYNHAWVCPSCKTAIKTQAEPLPEYAD